MPTLKPNENESKPLFWVGLGTSLLGSWIDILTQTSQDTIGNMSVKIYSQHYMHFGMRKIFLIPYGEKKAKSKSSLTR